MIQWRELARERLEALQATAIKEWPEAALLPDFPAVETDHTLLFVDGFYMPSSAPSDVICLELDQALKSYGLFLQNRWAKALKEEKDPHYLLNVIDHGRGLFLYVPPKVEATLQIRHHSTGGGLASPKMQITLGKNASLTLVQTGQSELSNSVIDVSLDAGSTLKFYDMLVLSAEAESHTTFRAELKRDARFELFHATEGAKKVHFSVSTTLLEENSSFLFRSLGMLRDERQAHIHALADHAAPNCTSRQHVKMALNGHSKSSFEGKIYVRSPAQKTEAYQLNNNLVLSPDAVAKSKPNLEIFADDVKASHGATFSQLSDEELFYLRSRGIPLSEAKALLMQAFCREIIDSLDVESLKAPLLETMAKVYA